MTIVKLRNIIGLLFITFHLFILLLIFIFYWVDWYEQEFLKIALCIVVPTFTYFSTLMIPSLVNENRKLSNKNINTTTVYISISLPNIFFLALLGVIIFQALRPETIGNFITNLGIVESLFSLFVGLILKSIYID